MLEIFKRKSQPVVIEPSLPVTTETKSSSNFDSFWQLLTHSAEFAQVSAWQALRYYEQISPVAIGIDKVTDEFKSLTPAIFDQKEQKYIAEHPFIEFLKHPNAAVSSQDFFKNYGNYFEITGQVYLMATGNPNRPPLEMMVVQPQFVSIEMGNDGFPQAYKVNSDSKVGGVTFTRKEVNKRLRYFDNLDRELWYVKDFNPNASSTNFYGASKLNPIFFEIEQHLFGSRHNLSLLKRGGRLTGALVTDQVLEDDVFERLKQEVSETIAGADNAGRIPVFEGGTKFEEMGKTNRDMDFLKLMESKTEAIFNRLGVPLSIVSAKQMTMNNLTVAPLALYDNAVSPLTSKLYGELTMFLGPRFGLPENQVLSVDPATIPALQSRRLTNLLMQSKLGVLTTNEQRSMLGREAAEGGDSVLAPANLVPIAQDEDTSDNRDEPATRKKFIQIMKEQKDLKGERIYTDLQIEGFADEEGLK
jgi:HK97 family phage portal protein